MLETTRNYVPRPAETLEVVDTVNTVNAPVSRRTKAYFKTMVGVFFVILAVLAVKYSPSAAADPGDYSDGLKTAVCKMLGDGMGPEYVVSELDRTFADLEVKTGQNLTRHDWTVFFNQAVAEKCPTYSSEWNR